MNKKDYIWGLCIGVILTFFIFWKFFLQGLYPFPTEFLLAWFEPWKSNSFVSGVITIPHKPVADDTFRQLYPFKALAMEAVKRFEWPLWNPYNGSGMPLLATMQTGSLSPFSGFFLIFKSSLAWSVFIIFQTFFLGLFTYLYCRKINFSKGAAVFSTVALAFSGFAIARLLFGEYIYALSLLPLMLYLVESFIGKEKKALFIPMATYLLCTSGHPQMTTYVFLFTISYFFYRLLQNRKTNIKATFRRVLEFAILLSIGIGMASVQLVPTVELFRHASLDTDSSKFIFERFLLPAQHLITIFIPNYFGNQATYNYWGSGDYIETVASVGLIPCFFAYIGVFLAKERKLQYFFLAALAVGILSTLDWFTSRLFFGLPIPIITTGAPSRVFSLTTFSICILAGYGFDSWTKELKLNKKSFYKLLPFFLFVFALTLGTILFYKLSGPCSNTAIVNCGTIALRNTLLEIFFFCLALACYFAYLVNIHSIVKKTAPFVILLTIGMLGLYNSNKFLPFTKTSSLLPGNVLLQNAKTIAGTERIFGLGSANLKADLGTHFHVYDPNYYAPLHNRRYGELVSYANTESSEHLARSDVEVAADIDLNPEAERRRNRLFALLSVGYILTKKGEQPTDKKIGETVWENKTWRIEKNHNIAPRVYLINDYQVIRDKDKILGRLFDDSFDYRKTVIVEDELPVPTDANNEPVGTAALDRYEENKVSIKTNSKSSAILVLTDNYYPGWKAYVNGKEENVYRANYTLRGVTVPKGKNLVEFRYEPLSLKIGIYISFLSLLAYILLLYKNYRRSSRSKSNR